MSSSSPSSIPHLNATQTQILTTLSKFYTFLTTHPFLPSSTLKTPPSTGWPPSHRHTWAKMGKSLSLNELLAHLPFIEDKNWLLAHETKMISYVNELNLSRMENDWEGKRYLFDPLAGMGRQVGLPENVIALTEGRLYGVWLLLDVDAGTITEMGVLGGHQPDFTDEEMESADRWRAYPTKPIKEFFQELQDKMSGANLGKDRNYVRC